MTAKDAIIQSITHDEIVHIDATKEGSDILLVECDDWVVNADVVEYWGGSGAGEEPWRIHVHTPLAPFDSYCLDCGTTGDTAWHPHREVYLCPACYEG